jgi:hypothetical protein
VVVNDGMTRGPVVRFSSAKRARLVLLITDLMKWYIFCDNISINIKKNQRGNQECPIQGHPQ